MTIEEVIKVAEECRTKWTNNVVNGRPNEQSLLTPYLGHTATYATVTNEINRWILNLTELSKKPRVSQSISKNLLYALSISLKTFNAALDHAGNGVAWVFENRNLGGSYAMSIWLTRELTRETAREASAIVDAAKERISHDLNALQLGSDQAKSFSLNWDNLNTQIAAIQEAEASATGTLTTLSKTATETTTTISALKEEVTTKATEGSTQISTSIATFKDSLETANNTLTRAQEIHTEAQKIRGETQSTAAKTKTDLDSSSAALKTAIEQQEKTQNRLTKALQNAQMEGLAGSFTQMKVDTGTEISNEKAIFTGALFYLAFIAAIGVVIQFKYGLAKTTEEFLFRMLPMLSLAAPGIWGAWFTAKKLGALNRVFSDYQYKSAAALAYESYRQTVAKAGSDELKQQLLAFAIHSFGENPTRYYDSTKSEAASPLESLVDKIPFFGKSKSEASKTAN